MIQEPTEVNYNTCRPPMEDDDEYLEVIIPGGKELPRARELSRETDFSLKPKTYELKDCY